MEPKATNNIWAKVASGLILAAILGGYLYMRDTRMELRIEMIRIEVAAAVERTRIETASKKDLDRVEKSFMMELGVLRERLNRLIDLTKGSPNT